MTISRAQLRPSNERSGNLCIGLVTCFFGVTILVGTAFFVLYLVLPVSAATSWFPIAGIVLIGIPWIFWILTCAYRLVTRSVGLGTSGKAPHRAATVAPASGATTAADVYEEGDVESPGVARRVRFGGATEMASDERRSGGGGGGTGRNAVHETTSKEEPNDEESSQRSNESEVPLALSMS